MRSIFIIGISIGLFVIILLYFFLGNCESTFIPSSTVGPSMTPSMTPTIGPSITPSMTPTVGPTNPVINMYGDWINNNFEDGTTIFFNRNNTVLYTNCVNNIFACNVSSKNFNGSITGYNGNKVIVNYNNGSSVVYQYNLDNTITDLSNGILYIRR